MRTSAFKRYLRRFTISQKFYILIGVVGVILLMELGSFMFALNTVSSIRAYVGGEGLWSKAQKESLDSLLRYGSTFDQTNYDQFLALLKVPLGDHTARTELQKPVVDYAVARQGFIDGGNNPQDISGMIFLFRRFGFVSYMKQAIAIWTGGDALIQTQLRIGSQIHDIVSADAPNDPATAAKIRPLLERAVENDRQLTELENQFSATLGEASRRISEWLFIGIFILTLILGYFALQVALYFSRVIAQVDNAKSEFVALASHQLRSPLNAINLSAEFLRTVIKPHGEDEVQALESIYSEVSRMSSLIDGILSVSRIELGSLSVEPREVDIVSIAREEARSLKRMAGAKGIEIHEIFDPKKLVARMDPTLLEIIFQNLLTNAIKYTPNGGDVSVKVERQRAQILICVRDSGSGIPEDQKGNIFKKLYRASNAIELDPQGTGLGLYIVKSMVREAGGDIWFESELGMGTAFFVAFPISGMERVSAQA